MVALEWEPLNTNRLVAFTLSGVGEGTYLLDPGTGHTRTLAPGRSVVCSYPGEGFYMAHVLNPNDQVVACAQITIRPEAPARFHTPEHEHSTVHLDYQGSSPALLSVDYGDGDGPVGGWFLPGQPPTSRFMPPGRYTGTIHDQQARRTLEQEYLVTAPPEQDPGIVVRPDPNDRARTTALLELTHITPNPQGVEVDWGDGTDPYYLDLPHAGDVLRHTYNPTASPSGDGVFFVMCSYVGTSHAPTTKAVQVPFPG